MSQTEHHKGRLIEIIGEDMQTRGKALVPVLLKQNNIEKGKWHEDDFECFRDELQELYYYHEANDTMYKIEDTKLDPYADIMEGSADSDGNIDYIATYYNGGTCLSECLESIVNSTLND